MQRHKPLQSLPTTEGSGAATCITFGSLMRATAAVGMDSGAVHVQKIGMDDATGMDLHGQRSGISQLSFDAKEQLLVGGACDGVVKVWDLSQEGRVVRTIKHSEEDVSSSFHTTVIPDARMVLATGCGAVVKIWDYRQRKCVREIETGGGALSHLSFSPDGAWVSSGTSAGELALWELRHGKRVALLQGNGTVEHADFHPRELVMAASCHDKQENEYSVHLWRVDGDFSKLHSSKCIRGDGEVGASRVRFSPCGRGIVQASHGFLHTTWWESIEGLTANRVVAGSSKADWVGRVGDLAINNKGQAIVASVDGTRPQAQTWIAKLAPPKALQSETGGVSATNDTKGAGREAFAQPPSPTSTEIQLISCDRANTLDSIPMSLFAIPTPSEPISVQEIKKGHGAATLKISSRMMLLKKWAVYREKGDNDGLLRVLHQAKDIGLVHAVVQRHILPSAKDFFSHKSAQPILGIVASLMESDRSLHNMSGIELALEMIRNVGSALTNAALRTRWMKIRQAAEELCDAKEATDHVSPKSLRTAARTLRNKLRPTASGPR